MQQLTDSPSALHGPGKRSKQQYSQDLALVIELTNKIPILASSEYLKMNMKQIAGTYTDGGK